MASVVLSEAEKVYVVHGVQDDLRTDGRGCEDYRWIEVETDVVSNTTGSARVKIENLSPLSAALHVCSILMEDISADTSKAMDSYHAVPKASVYEVPDLEREFISGVLTVLAACLFQGHTDVLVGVKAEMATPKLDRPCEGFLEFFVDCSANATPAFEGRGGEELGTEIANMLYKVFDNKSSIDLESLCILPREHCWTLYIDVLLVHCGGNLFDTISIGVKAALFNTRIPKVSVLEDDGGNKEIELSDDPYDCMRLNVENVPCIVTLCKIGHRHVVDATLQEEACSLASVLVAINIKGTLTCMRKMGKGSLDPECIFEMIETGKRVAKSLHLSLRNVLNQEESMGKKRQTIGFLK